MSEVSKEYNFKSVEEKWVEAGTILYITSTGIEETRIIDTPPPTLLRRISISETIN